MPRDAFVDAYIAKAAPFAQPILTELRERLHSVCPEAAEAKKWGMPSFLYQGKILANMAAFKGHATFGFWGGDARANEEATDAMGNFGKLAALHDLPDQAMFEAYARSAMAEIEQGRKAPPKHAPKPAPSLHPDFAKALASAPAAQAALDGFPPSAQRDYLDWIAEAKQDSTRDKRIAQAVEWLTEGKRRHWKYQNC